MKKAPKETKKVNDSSSNNDVVVKQGSKVSLHYTGTLEDGTVFDSSEGHDPLEFTAGEGMVIKGFDNGVMGLKKGEEKEIVILPENAYGKVEDSLRIKVPKESFGEHTDKLKEGVILRLMSPTGQAMNAKVLKIEDKEVMLDLNHPLAGKTLKFKVKIVDIQ
jgi:FKBP-type peptidyl-prolyl cis-trans isomerase 2